MKKKKVFLIVLCFMVLLQSQISYAAVNPYVYSYYNDNGQLCYNCTWYAWQRAYEKVGIALPGFTGNAKGWYQRAQNAGYAVGSEPRENSIIVWTDSTFGHVGFVESVSGNNVTVNEAGTNYGSSSYTCNTYDKNYLKTRWGQTLLGYIYLESISINYNPEGNLDYIAGGKGNIAVSGWAFDRDDSLAAVGIHVYIGNECIATFEANKIRTDVNTAFPGIGNNHGFEEIITTDKTGEQTVNVFAYNIGGGTNTLIGSATVYMDTTNNPEGHLEYIAGGKGNVTVSGWAFDRDDSLAAVGIHVYIGNECIAAFEANKIRTDVNTAFPGIGNNHGFEEIITTDKTGEQTINIFAYNIGGGTNTLIGSATVYIEPKMGNTSTEKPEEDIIAGDVNRDSQITLSDVQIVLRAALRIVNLTDKEKEAADINHDGSITLSDAQMVLCAALRIIIL